MLQELLEMKLDRNIPQLNQVQQHVEQENHYVQEFLQIVWQPIDRLIDHTIHVYTGVETQLNLTLENRLFFCWLNNLHMTSRRDIIGLASSAMMTKIGCIRPQQMISVITMFIRQNSFRPYSPE